MRANLAQFLWLVLSTVLVGMTLGVERTIVPLLGKEQYHLPSVTVVLAFIVAFGATKALLNLVAGHLSDTIGRRPVLIVGWMLGIPMIVLLLLVHSWAAVIVANVFLGANQALAWTMTVTKQLDLVTGSERGLAMGINEATGYIGVAVSTFATGLLASRYGLESAPFVYGAVIVAGGLAVAARFVRETRISVGGEVQRRAVSEKGCADHRPAQDLRSIVWTTTVTNPTLSAMCQAGLVNKLADTLVWGLVPLYLAELRLPVAQIAEVGGIYTLVWGLAQFGTGVLSDRIGRKPPIVGGMILLGVSIIAFGVGRGWAWWATTAAVMGIGMALLYPNLNAAVADIAPVAIRGGVLGVYRLWRDGGYALGGLLLGLTSGAFGMRGSVFVVGVIVLASALVVAVRMAETRQQHAAP
jgi:MFS family permease